MKVRNILTIIAVFFAILIMSGGAFGYYVTDPDMCPNARNPFRYALSLSNHNIPCETTQDCRDAGSNGYCLQNGWINGSCGHQLCGDSGSPDPDPIDGGWSAWYNTTSCSQVCDGGALSQSRSCNNPTPQYGGDYCSGSSSRTISCNTQQCTLSAPTASINLNLSGNYSLSWTSGSAERYGIRDYTVYESINGAPFTALTTTNSTSYNIGTPADDTNYNYYVTMTSNEPLTVASNTVELDGPSGPLAGDTTPPIAPTLETLSPLNDGNFTLNWTANPGSDPESGILGYRVWADYNYGAFAEIANVGLSTTYDITNNTPPGVYGYYIQAFNGDGLSSTSNAVYTETVDANVVTPDQTAPIAPVIDTNSIPSYNDGNFDLNWTANPGSDADSNIWQYLIWSNFNGGAFTILTNNDLNTIYEIRNNSPDGNYGYFIQIFNEFGLDSNSNTVYTDTNALAADLTAPTAPILQSLPTYNDGDFDLNWTANPGSDPETGIGRYYVWSNYEGGTFTLLADTVLATTHSIINNAPDGNYSYFIQVLNGAGLDSNSNIVYTDTNALMADSTPPTAPIIDSVTAVNDGNFDLNWTANPGSDPETGITTYRLFSNYNGGVFSALTDLNNTTTLYNILNNAPDGNYGYYVRIFNGAGMSADSNTVYTYTSSTGLVAPTLENIPPYNAGTFDLDWSTNPGSDPGFGVDEYVVWWRLDNGVWSILATTLGVIYNVAGVQTVDGNYQYHVQLIGNSGRDANSNIVSSIMDTVVPDVNIFNPGAWWQTTDYNVDFDVDYGLSGQNIAQVQIDGNGWQNLPVDFNLLMNTDGNHQVDYNFVDNSMNETSGSFYSARDATAPVVSVINPGNPWANSFYNLDFIVDFSVSGEQLSQYQINGNGWQNFAFDFNTPITVDGNHTIDYNFVDVAGNETSGTLYTGLDTTAPTISNINNPGATWQTSDFNVEFQGLGFNVSGQNSVQYRINGGAWTTFTLTNGTDFNVPITTDGNHTVDYNFVDNAGNNTSGTLTALLDTQAPSFSVLNSGLPWRNTDFNIDYIVDFSVSGPALAQYQIDGNGWMPFPTDYNAPITTDGAHNVDVNFCNNAGSCDGMTVTAYLDQTAPTLTITNPGATWYAGDFNVSFTDVNFDVSGILLAQYRVDGGGWQNITGDFNIPITTDGNHSIEYYLGDMASNVTSGTIYALRDTNSVVVIATNPGAGWTNSPYDVDFIVDFGNSGQSLAQYQIDGAGWNNFATDFNVPFNIDGSYNLDYNFCNGAGNCSSGLIFTGLDSTAPTIGSIVNPGASSSVPGDFNIDFVDVNFDISGRATADYQIDLGGWTPFSNDFNVPITTDGNHQVDYRFTDNAGNITIGTIHAERDTGGVVVTTVNPGATWQTTPYDVDFIVDFGGSGQALAQYDLNGNGWQNFSTDFNVPINSDGIYNVDYNFCNAIGFCGSGSLTAILDSQAPTTTISPSGWQNADFNATLSCNDVMSGCTATSYRIDTDPSTTVAYGVWNNYTTPIAINIDGNYAIDFNSVDVAGNTETVQNAYLLLDTNNPVMDANYPTTSVNNNNGNVQVTASATDPLSGIIGYWFSIISGVWTWSTNPIYTFNSVSNGDYNVSVIATDEADNNSATSVVPVTVNVSNTTNNNTGGSSSSGSSIYSYPIDNNDDTEDINGQTQEEDSEDNSIIDGEENSEEGSEEIIDETEEKIELLPGNLIISDANMQATGPTGLFGLGSAEEQASVAIPVLILLIVIVGAAIFLTQTTTGQEIVKGSKK